MILAPGIHTSQLGPAPRTGVLAPTRMHALSLCTPLAPSLLLSLSPHHPASLNLKQYVQGSKWRIRGTIETHVADSCVPRQRLCGSGMTNDRAPKVCNPFIDFQPSLPLVLWASRERESQTLRAEIAQEGHGFPIGQTSEAAWPKYGAHYKEMWFVFPTETNSLAWAEVLGLCVAGTGRR